MDSKALGRLAEEIAVEFLKKQNYQILERNWKLKNFGEVDIIAQKNNFLNFIEVKALKQESGSENFLPEDHFNQKKFLKISKLAHFYANQKNFDNYIISLVAIAFEPKLKINYYENILK